MTYLFEILKLSGDSFTKEVWEIVFKRVIFPIFEDLKPDENGHTKESNEDMQVWMSTTLIQALRELIDLVTHFFLQLDFIVDEVLEFLVISCIQENEALARIGSDCISQLILKNVANFNDNMWTRFSNCLILLLEITAPSGLYFEAEENKEQDCLSLTPFGKPYAKKPTRADFQGIITKCVLHLLVIETCYDIFNQSYVFKTLPAREMFKVGDALYESYVFAKCFNEDLPLRTELHRLGFMKQLPNLLKQETSSAISYLIIISHMFNDNERKLVHSKVESKLIPFMYDILGYNAQLDPVTQKRNINAWAPVILIIATKFVGFPAESFKKHIGYFYPHFNALLLLPISVELQTALFKIFKVVGDVFGISAQAPVWDKTVTNASLDSVYEDEVEI